MEKIKKGSDEWRIIAVTILYFAENNITKGGAAYIPETRTLTIEEAYDAVVELLAEGLLVLCFPDGSDVIRLVSAIELGQEPQPKPLFKKLFHGTYGLLQSYCKKGGKNGTN